MDTSSRSSRPGNVAYRTEGKHTNHLNDLNNTRIENGQRGDNYDSESVDGMKEPVL